LYGVLGRRTQRVEDQEHFIALDQLAHLLHRLRRAVAVVVRDKIDPAAVDAAGIVDHLEIGILDLSDDAVGGSGPAVSLDVADLDFGVRRAGVVFLLGKGSLRGEHGKRRCGCDGEQRRGEQTAFLVLHDNCLFLIGDFEGEDEQLRRNLVDIDHFRRPEILAQGRLVDLLCFIPSAERSTSLSFQTASFVDTASRSRGALRPSFCLERPTLSDQRAQGMPGARCARSLAWCVKNTRVSHHGHTGFTRHSLRNGFNGFLRALPGDRACLPPSLAELPSANLTPASGRQDHTTSPSASAPFVSVLSASTAPRRLRP
jgi:hypothetical protein